MPEKVREQLRRDNDEDTGAERFTVRKEQHYAADSFVYDFPQKRKGMIAAMYLVGSMMNDPKLKKNLGGKMTEGMLMPYQKVLKDHEKRTSHVFTEKT